MTKQVCGVSGANFVGRHLPPERDKTLIALETETDAVKLFQEIRDRNKD